jgi:uncharacterized membrane protein YfcA
MAFGVSGLAGSLGGAALAQTVDGKDLLFWFAWAMIAIAVSMLIPRKNQGDPAVRLNLPMVLRLVPVGLAAGFAAGFFGIGGGFLIVPGLMTATGMTLANAGASSLVSVALFGGATSASYLAAGQFAWPLFGALVAGGAAGTLAALPLSRRLASRAGIARTIFALMVIGVAVMILVG